MYKKVLMIILVYILVIDFFELLHTDGWQGGYLVKWVGKTPDLSLPVSIITLERHYQQTAQWVILLDKKEHLTIKLYKCYIVQIQTIYAI